MTQKETILKLLNENGVMTHGELSIAIYGDNYHMPNLYASLMSLVNSGRVLRRGQRPSYYSIGGVVDLPIVNSSKRYDRKVKVNDRNGNSVSYNEITNESITKVDNEVECDSTYGAENKLITDCLMMFPHNTNINIVAMKIGLIDITNSTNISRYKSKISVVELARVISTIPYIDNRIEGGDPEIVNIIARNTGKINLFSFASKYCCYHNRNLYGKDDYSIFDTVLKNYLPRYFKDITKSQIKHWVDTYDYVSYNNYIAQKLDELDITTEYRKRKFDHFVWYRNRKG
ncbi:MAG: hypothetical protein K2M47_04410 [Clostridiales bacterium]|nr:hypothetical protein [Clostridiales bacterium]